MQSSRVLLIATAVVAVIVVTLLVRSREPRRPVEERAQARIAERGAPAMPEAPAPSPSRSPMHYTLQTESEVEVPPDQVTPKQAAALAARYRRLARFPQDSRPIENGLDPIGVAEQPKVVRSSPPHSPGPTLITFPALPTVEAPNSVVIYAQVVEREKLPPEIATDAEHRNQEPKEPRIEPRGIRGEIRTPNGVAVEEFDFRDDGRDGDAEPGDRLYTATIMPDPDHPEAFHGDYEVLVTADTMSGDRLSAVTGFQYNVPIAHLTGQYRDEIVDGSLVISGEVDVEQPGTLKLEGTLATEDAKMLGHAQKVVNLQPGRAWIPLTFYGLMFRDRNVDGPYNLFSVQLSNVGVDPPERSDVVPAAHVTRPYTVSEFSDKPYQDPDLLRKAEALDPIARRAESQ